MAIRVDLSGVYFMRRWAGMVGAALMLTLGQAGAQTITNGGFDGNPASPGSAWSGCVNCFNSIDYSATTQQLGGLHSGSVVDTSMSGWSTSAGYEFVLTAPQAINGFTGPNGSGRALWSPTVGAVTGNGGLGSVAIAASPSGGNFLAIDPGYLNTTTLSGNTIASSTWTSLSHLLTGATYIVSFNAASAEQKGFDLASPPTNPFVQWTVAEYTAAGTAPACTPPNTGAVLCQAGATIALSNHAFSGWVQQQVSFVATAATMTLAFIASTNVPSGQPPYALLDGVVVTQQVPEPATAGLLLVGLGGLLGARRRAIRGAAAKRGG